MARFRQHSSRHNPPCISIALETLSISPFFHVSSFAIRMPASLDRDFSKASGSRLGLRPLSRRHAALEDLVSNSDVDAHVLGNDDFIGRGRQEATRYIADAIGACQRTKAKRRVLKRKSSIAITLRARRIAADRRTRQDAFGVLFGRKSKVEHVVGSLALRAVITQPLSAASRARE